MLKNIRLLDEEQEKKLYQNVELKNANSFKKQDEDLEEEKEDEDDLELDL